MSRKDTKKVLLSDQISPDELAVILRELKSIINCDVPGDVAELGCYIGTTSVWLARELKGTDRKLFLYDSFAGLPAKTSEDTSPLGEQFVAGELYAPEKTLRQNIKRYAPADVMVSIKKAWFSDLSGADIPSKVAFAFLDGDFYQSIIDSLRLVWPRMSAGSTIIIDDYSNQALPGVERALSDWRKEHNFSLTSEHSLAILKDFR